MNLPTFLQRPVREKGLLTPAIKDYLAQLLRFTVLRKKDPFTNTDAVTSSAFTYDFQAVENAGYGIDPDDLPTFDTPTELYFFHDEDQRRHIANQLRIYSNTPVGLGRLIQRSNLKLMYRKFAVLPPDGAPQANSRTSLEANVSAGNR